MAAAKRSESLAARIEAAHQAVEREKAPATPMRVGFMVRSVDKRVKDSLTFYARSQVPKQTNADFLEGITTLFEELVRMANRGDHSAKALLEACHLNPRTPIVDRD